MSGIHCGWHACGRKGLNRQLASTLLVALPPSFSLLPLGFTLYFCFSDTLFTICSSPSVFLLAMFSLWLPWETENRKDCNDLFLTDNNFNTRKLCLCSPTCTSIYPLSSYCIPIYLYIYIHTSVIFELCIRTVGISHTIQVTLS